MSDAPTPELEKRLRELTNWQGGAPELWRRALRAAGPLRTGRFRAVFLTPRVPGWLLGGIAAVVIFGIVGVVMHHTGGIARLEPQWSAGESRRAPELTPMSASADEAARSRFKLEGIPDLSYGYQLPYGPGRGRGAVSTQMPTPHGLDADSRLRVGRHVIRKATIELVTQDVRAAFLKASHLISEAKGEYVQDSSLTGTGDRLEANLTLRIVAQRLPEVLNELRQLGKVRSERTGGEDVTGQIVDLDARLRNEQRVEVELLELLEKREDAPLKDILELRRSIAEVRESIERLIAQRDRLSRLVSLATVLVIIRPADAPEPEPAPGLAAYLSDAFGTAWHNGALFLLYTLAMLLSVLVGGAIWWVLLIAAILLLRAHRRRSAKAA